MKVIVNYKIYDTENAENILTWKIDPYNNGYSANIITKKVYMTKKNNYFLYTYTGDYFLKPSIKELETFEVIKLCEENDITGQEKNIMKYFGHIITEG